MYLLATLFPALRRLRIPLPRDGVMLLMLVANEMLLGLETYLAHLISGTIVWGEWIPIIFGPIAGVLLLLAILLGVRRRKPATALAVLTLALSIIVGLMGAFFHLRRAILFAAPPGQRFSVPLLVWAPPVLAPLTFVLVGLLGLCALYKEMPVDSGALDLLDGKRLSLPFSKTRFYLLLVGLGALATVISSVLDHARTNFSNPWLWVPTAVGIFATVVAVTLGTISGPTRFDLWTFLASMILMIVTGMVGSGLHIMTDLTSQGAVVGERFLRDAPILAPMLFADIGTLGLIAMLDPHE